MFFRVAFNQIPTTPLTASDFEFSNGEDVRIVSVVGSTSYIIGVTPVDAVNTPRTIAATDVTGFELPLINENYSVRQSLVISVIEVEPSGSGISVDPSNGKVVISDLTGEDLSVTGNPIAFSPYVLVDNQVVTPMAPNRYEITFNYAMLLPIQDYSIRLVASHVTDR